MKPALSVIFFTVSSGAGLGLLFLLAWRACSIHRRRRLTGGGRSVAAGPGYAGAFVIDAASGESQERLAGFQPVQDFLVVSRRRVCGRALPGNGALCLVGHLQFRALELCLGCGDGSVPADTLLHGDDLCLPENRTTLADLAHPPCLSPVGIDERSIVVDRIDAAAAAPVAARMAVVLVLCGAALKLAYFIRFADDSSDAPSVNEALNLGIDKLSGKTNAKVRLLDVGHTHGTFLTHEFGFELARNHASILKIVLFFFAFALPFILLALSPRLALLASISTLIGLLVERWLFLLKPDMWCGSITACRWARSSSKSAHDTKHRTLNLTSAAENAAQ